MRNTSKEIIENAKKPRRERHLITDKSQPLDQRVAALPRQSDEYKRRDKEIDALAAAAANATGLSAECVADYAKDRIDCIVGLGADDRDFREAAQQIIKEVAAEQDRSTIRDRFESFAPKVSLGYTDDTDAAREKARRMADP
ncbi:MAG: hypothetical protein ACR2KS_03310 [Candidatus Eremiobacter antarcticus]